MVPSENVGKISAAGQASRPGGSCKHQRAHRGGGNPVHPHVTTSSLFFLMKPDRNLQQHEMKHDEDSEYTPRALCGSTELIFMSL